MTDHHVNIFPSEDDGGSIPDIPDLALRPAFGETPEAALAEVLRARAAWIEAARAEGNEIPSPAFRPAIYKVA